MMLEREKNSEKLLVKLVKNMAYKVIIMPSANGLLIGAIERIPRSIKKRNILTMLTEWKLKNHSALPRDAMDLAGS